MWNSPFLTSSKKVIYTLIGLGTVGVLFLSAPGHVPIQRRAIPLEVVNEEDTALLEERLQRDAVRILLFMLTFVLIFWSFIVLIATEPWVDIIDFFDRPPPTAPLPVSPYNP